MSLVDSQYGWERQAEPLLQFVRCHRDLPRRRRKRGNSFCVEAGKSSGIASSFRCLLFVVHSYIRTAIGAPSVAAKSERQVS